MRIRCKDHLLAFDVDEGQAVQAALRLDGVGSAGLGRVLARSCEESLEPSQMSSLMDQKYGFPAAELRLIRCTTSRHKNRPISLIQSAGVMPRCCQLIDISDAAIAK